MNLESPLTNIGDPYPGKDVHFQGDPRLAAGLADAGIDVVNMANNHAVDQGRRPACSTRSAGSRRRA